VVQSIDMKLLKFFKKIKSKNERLFDKISIDIYPEQSGFELVAEVISKSLKNGQKIQFKIDERDVYAQLDKNGEVEFVDI